VMLQNLHVLHNSMFVIEYVFNKKCNVCCSINYFLGFFLKTMQLNFVAN
jgi:hypothetical protein